MKNLKYHVSMVMRGLAVLMKMEKAFVLLNLVIEAITPLAPYVNIYMSALIIDELIGSRNTNTLAVYVIITVGLNLILSLLLNGLNHLKDYHQSQFYINERMHFSKKNMSMDYENLENSEVHLLYGRIKIENQTGFNAFYLYTRTGSFVREAVNIILAVALTVSLFANEDVSLVSKLGILALTALVICASYYSTKKSNKVISNLYGSFAPLNGLFNFYSDFCFNYNAGKDVRLYAMKETVADESDKLFKLSNDRVVGAAKINLKYNILNAASSDVLRISTYIFVILACAAGNITIGSITKYVSCIVRVIGSFSSIINSVRLLMDNNEYLERYFKYLDIPANMYHGTLTTEKRADNNYELEFHNVSFKYPGTDKYVLRNINMKLNVGQRMAVVGMNGSGKTTMIKLLCRLYDPTDGEITLNGIDIKKYEYEEYLNIFSVVFQDFKLFSFPLGQNVSAVVNYDIEKAKKCLEMAGFSERLSDMSKGLDTPLYKDFDNDGVEISGGEAQKIALARALYKNAPFIVLDEPTAALDPIAEFEIYSKFNEVVGNKTAVYISHRLSSCRFCDDIAVFHEGELIQRGNHDILLSDRNGKYYELWNAQAQYYNDKNNPCKSKPFAL